MNTNLSTEQRSTLIRALNETAHKLETGSVHYNWNNMASCNCGVLAQTLLGIDNTTLWGELATHKWKGLWGSAMAGWNCPVTELPLTHILQKLHHTGLTGEDMFHLENCNDYQILVKLPNGISHNSLEIFSDREAVAAYMKTWATLLEQP